MSKTSQLEPLINVATNDLVQVVDVSDDTMASTGTNKKITLGDLATGIGATGALQPTIPLGTSSQYYRGDKTWQTLNKTTVGLSNVTNESKATMFTNPTFTGTVSGITSTMVGLGNVTNESKSTMFTSPTFTGTPTAPTAAPSTTNTTQIATTEFVQTALQNLKFTHTQKGQSIVLDDHTIEGNVLNDFTENNKVSINESGNRVAIVRNRYGVDIYDYINGSWSKITTLTFSNILPSGVIYSVAMNKEGTVVVFNAINTSSSYFVMAYNLQNNVWTQMGNTMSLTWAPGQTQLPICLNSAGTRIAVGEPFFDSVIGPDTGRILIFDYTGSQWVLTTSVLSQGGTANYPLNALAGTKIGSRSVALSGDGNTLAYVCSGTYYNWLSCFDITNPTSIQTIGDIFSIGALTWGQFVPNSQLVWPRSVQLNETGDVLSFVSPYVIDKDGWSINTNGTPAVLIYKRTGNTWVKYGRTSFATSSSNIDEYSTGALPAGSSSGTNISLNSAGDTIVVYDRNYLRLGVYSSDDTRGCIRVYKLIGDLWYKLGINDIYGLHEKELFGSSLKLSSDGSSFIALGINSATSTLQTTSRIYNTDTSFYTLKYATF